MMDGSASAATVAKTGMIDATHLKADRALRARGMKTRQGCPFGRTGGGMFTGPHAITNENEGPIQFHMAIGSVGDDTKAAALPGGLPSAADCRLTGVMAPTGSVDPLKTGTQSHVSLAGRPGQHPSDTTGVNQDVATGSSSSSGGSTTSGGSQPAATNARPKVFPSAIAPAATVPF